MQTLLNKSSKTLYSAKSNSIREWLIDAGLKQEAVDDSCRQLLRFGKKEQALRGATHFNGYMGSGNRSAEVMIVSGMPDDSEKNTKIIGCFSDYSIVLTVMLNRLGIDFEDAYWTTAIKTDEKRVTFDTIQEQRRYIQEEVVYVNPSLIISLGNTALTSLLGEKTKWDSIGDNEEVGYTVHDALADVPIIVLEHPGDYVETDDFKEKFYTSWKKVKAAFD